MAAGGDVNGAGGARSSRRRGGPQKESRRKGTAMAGMNGSDARATVAVIGAGIMGSAMTRNLVAAGLNTRVWDGSPAATAPLAAAGAVVAPSGREAGRGAGVGVTMPAPPPAGEVG